MYVRVCDLGDTQALFKEVEIVIRTVQKVMLGTECVHMLTGFGLKIQARRIKPNRLAGNVLKQLYAFKAMWFLKISRHELYVNTV